MSKVLVIDDSISACLAIERMLGSQGFDVVWELDAITALSAVEKHLPDLVICDLMLPDISGFDICNSLRKNPLLSSMPVLLISGNVNDEVRLQARECGAAGIVAKPFTPKFLLDEIQAILTPIDPAPAKEATPSAPTGMWQPVASELEAFRALDSRLTCILDMDGGLVSAEGWSREDSLTLALQREVSALKKLAAFAADETEATGQGTLLTFETHTGVRMIESLGGGHQLILILRDSGALGLARCLMKKKREPLKRIIHQQGSANEQ